MEQMDEKKRLEIRQRIRDVEDYYLDEREEETLDYYKKSKFATDKTRLD